MKVEKRGMSETSWPSIEKNANFSDMLTNFEFQEKSVVKLLILVKSICALNLHLRTVGSWNFQHSIERFHWSICSKFKFSIINSPALIDAELNSLNRFFLRSAKPNPRPSTEKIYANKTWPSTLKNRIYLRIIKAKFMVLQVEHLLLPVQLDCVASREKKTAESQKLWNHHRTNVKFDFLLRLYATFWNMFETFKLLQCTWIMMRSALCQAKIESQLHVCVDCRICWTVSIGKLGFSIVLNYRAKVPHRKNT